MRASMWIVAGVAAVAFVAVTGGLDAALAQAPAAPPPAAPPAAPSDTQVLAQFETYRKLLHDENEDFLGLVKLVGGVITTLIGGLAALFAFLGWKTFSEARAAAKAAVDQQVMVSLAKAVEAAVAARGSDIEAAYKKSLAALAAELEDQKERTSQSALAEASVKASVFLGAHILWVDDQPARNSGLARTLEQEGAKVTTALSTSEALTQLQAPGAAYRAVISDMGRPEGPDAGVVLAHEMHVRNLPQPLIIFTVARAARGYGAAAASEGAFAVVNGASALFRAIESALRQEPHWQLQPDNGLSVPHPPSRP